MIQRLKSYLEQENFDQTVIDLIMSDFDLIEIADDKKDKYISYLIENYNNMKRIKGGDFKTLRKLNTIDIDPLMIKANDQISKIIGYMLPKYDFSKEGPGILGVYDETKIDHIVDCLNEDGYYIYDTLLDDQFCQAVLDSCQNITFNPKLGRKKPIKGIHLDNKASSTYWTNDQYEISKIRDVQRLITDPTILSVAQKYIQSVPINIQTNVWWSVAGKKDPTQDFHQDCEDLKFLKVFIYLSDVTKKNGPHCYVRGSRNNLKTPSKYNTSNRVPDSFIKQNYPAEDILKFTGKKGTIIFENTNGFHKGSPLIEGHRIMLQLEFCCGTRGIINNVAVKHLRKKKVSLQVNPEFTQKYPLVFLKYT